MLDLFVRFLIVGALAFGGGQAAIPLVERLAVGEKHWLTPAEFTTGVGLSYATPGPVLILAAFVGYHVAGIPGAIVASAAVFAVPVLLAGFAAALVARLQGARWFRSFGRFAAAAAIGLLGVTLLSLAKPVVELQPLLLLGAAFVFLIERLGVHSAALIGVATAFGAWAGLEHIV